MMQRLENDPGADPLLEFDVQGRTLNGDTPSVILGSAATPLGSSAPPGWDPLIHGDFATTEKSRHFSFDGAIAKCDSPRLGFIPIVASGDPGRWDLDWNKGDPYPAFPSGAQPAKVVGFYWVIIRAPDRLSDWNGNGNGNLRTSSIDILWFGPNATCADGSEFDPNIPGLPTKSVRLVNETS